MAQFYKENKVILLLYMLLFLLIGTVLLLYSKSEIHLWLNQFHSPGLDVSFKYLTFLGDGNFALILSVVFLLIATYRKAFFLAAANISAGLIAQLFKRLVFSDVFRPIRYFEGTANLHLVEGVKLHGKYSFPSGHAATAFAIFICVAVMVENKVLKILCLIAAIAVAYSRVYISQHFLIDIWAGSLIGLLSCFIFYLIIYKNKAKWLDKTLIKSFKK